MEAQEALDFLLNRDCPNNVDEEKGSTIFRIHLHCDSIEVVAKKKLITPQRSDDPDPYEVWEVTSMKDLGPYAE